MIRSHIRLISAALACGLALGGCVATNGTGPPGWGSKDYGALAVAAGNVIGETKADATIAKEADKLYQFCGAMRAVSTGATIFSPEKYRQAAQIAQAAIITTCDQKPRSIREGLVTLASAWAQIALLLYGPPPAPS